MHFLGLDGGAKLPEWWLGRPPPTSVGTSLSEVTLSLLARPAHAWMLRWTFLGCLLGVALTHREGYSVDMSYICIWICDARCGELRFSLTLFQSPFMNRTRGGSFSKSLTGKQHGTLPTLFNPSMARYTVCVGNNHECVCTCLWLASSPLTWCACTCTCRRLGDEAVPCYMYYVAFEWQKVDYQCCRWTYNRRYCF